MNQPTHLAEHHNRYCSLANQVNKMSHWQSTRMQVHTVRSARSKGLQKRKGGYLLQPTGSIYGLNNCFTKNIHHLRRSLREIKAVPLHALTSPGGSRRFRLPEFLDSPHRKVVRLSALRPGRLTRRGNLWHWKRLCRPQDHSAVGGIKSAKYPNDPIANRTRDIPACNAVPFQTALPLTPTT